MKRFLVSLIGRANLGYKGNGLRERDLCYSYVYGKNKAEAISKFWEQIEKSSGLKGFERRDFKITAERWEKDSFLDVNGNVVTDIEWAIPFDLLASVEMVHDEHFKNYKLAVPESIMAQAELEEMKSCMIKSLDEMQEDLNRAEAIQNGKIINPEKKYHVISWKIGAPVDEKTDCGIWDGSGMAHFSEGFGGFTYSADGWLYFAQEAEDEITAEPDQETAQESNSEAQESKNAWEISVFFSKDQILRELNQLKTDLGSGDVVGCTKGNEHQRNRYIKALEIAIIQLMASEKPLMPHLDAGKEIIKEISTEATGSNLEAQKATSAVEFEKISDYEIKASWNGETIGRISIHYKSYSPVIKIYRISGNMREKFDSLDDAKMHLIQNFRAKAQEALDQAEDEKIKLKIRNKIDVLDDQIAELFIKGAEMRTGKEA